MLLVELAMGAPATNCVKSPANFCCQVAAWFLDMFCNFYLVKNQQIVKNSTTTEARLRNGKQIF
jgi:hypothetical protein